VWDDCEQEEIEKIHKVIMRKAFILSLVLIFSLGVYGQKARKAVGVIPDDNTLVEQDVRNRRKVQRHTNKVDPLTNSLNRQRSGNLTFIPMGQSGNAFGFSGNPRTYLYADPNLNSIVFTHRMTGGDSVQGNSRIAYDLSTDGGQTWSDNIQVYTPPGPGVGTTYPQDAARFPQGVIKNSYDNSNPDSAQYLMLAPTLNGSNGIWGEVFYSYNQLTDITPDSSLYTGNMEYTGNASWSSYIPSAFPSTWADRVYFIDGSYPAPLYDYGGHFFVKQSFIDGSTPSFIGFSDFPILGSLDDVIDTKIKHEPMIPNYQETITKAEGYTVLLANSPDIENGTNSFHPVLYRLSTTSLQGVLDEVQGIQLGGPKGFESIKNYWSDSIIESLPDYEPGFNRDDVVYNMGYHLDVTVDERGNPHIIGVVGIANTTGSWYPYEGTMATWHIYTTDHGLSWEAVPLYDNKHLTGNIGGLIQNNRINASMTWDGRYIFFSWLDTDAQEATDNSEPNMYVVAYDPRTESHTDVINVTANSAYAGQIFDGVMSQFVFTEEANDSLICKIPISFTQYTVPGDPYSEMNFIYIDGVEVKFPLPDEPSWGPYEAFSEAINKVTAAVVRITKSTASMISDQYYITAAHGPLDGDNYFEEGQYVRNIHGQFRSSDSIWYDLPHDFAVVKTDSAFDISYAIPIASEFPPIGDTVFMVGHPGNITNCQKGWAVSFGTVIDSCDAQGNASFRMYGYGGFSGGPICNKNGEIIAVATGGGMIETPPWYIDTGYIHNEVLDELNLYYMSGPALPFIQSFLDSVDIVNVPGGNDSLPENEVDTYRRPMVNQTVLAEVETICDSVRKSAVAFGYPWWDNNNWAIARGTGTLIAQDLILTASHVTNKVYLTHKIGFADGELIDAVVLANSPLYDMAVIKLLEPAPSKYKPVGITDRKISYGSGVFTVGNPSGIWGHNGGWQVLAGMSTGTDKGGEGFYMASQTGNSGGSFFGLNGKIAGILTGGGGGLWDYTFEWDRQDPHSTSWWSSAQPPFGYGSGGVDHSMVKEFVSNFVVESGVGYNYLYGETLMADGNIMACGRTYNGQDNDIVLNKYDQQGLLIAQYLFDDGRSETARDIQKLTDGKLIVVGGSSASGKSDWLIGKFNINGTLDTNFGTLGTVLLSIDTVWDEAQGVDKLSDGSIIVGGNSHKVSDNDIIVAKFDSTGNLDSDFGENGIFRINLDTATFDLLGNQHLYKTDDLLTDVLVQPDDKILICGYSTFKGDFDEGYNDTYYKGCVIRITSDGVIDSSFNLDGIAHIRYGGDGTTSNVTGIDLQPDGKIVVTGTLISWECDVGVARLNTDGSYDNTFNGCGYMAFLDNNNPVGYGPVVVNFHDYGKDIKVLDDGSLLVAGESWYGDGDGVWYHKVSKNGQFMLRLIKLDSLGIPDSTFGITGYKYIPVGGDDFASSLIVNGDMAAIAGYTYNNGSSNYVLKYISLDTTVQLIPQAMGWNIFASNVMPDSLNMASILQTQIDSSNLIKIADGSGGFIQEISPGVWINTIGNMTIGEGYYLKLNNEDTLKPSGRIVRMPYDVALASGWNLFGYIDTISNNAMDIVQPLIDSNNLVKVLDEAGNILEYIEGIGWVNNIGNMSPGEGYYIKIINDDTLTIGGETLSKSYINYLNYVYKEGSIFDMQWIGNPYMPMHIVMKDLEKARISIGDEIGIFAENICIGSAVISDNQSPVISILLSDDPTTEDMDGGIDGGKLSFKLHRDGEDYNLSAKVPIFFDGLSTQYVSFTGTSPSDENEINKNDFYVGIVTPNPFSKNANVKVSLPERGYLKVSIKGSNGMLYGTLIDGAQAPGSNYISVERETLTSGVYMMVIEYRSKNYNRSVIRKLVIK